MPGTERNFSLIIHLNLLAVSGKSFPRSCHSLPLGKSVSKSGCASLRVQRGAHQVLLRLQTPSGMSWGGFGAPFIREIFIKGSSEATESRLGPGGGAGPPGLGAETLSHSLGVLERNSEPPRPLPGPLLWFDNHIFLFLKQMFFSPLGT